MDNINKLNMKYTYKNKGSKELVMVSIDKDKVRLPSWASMVSYTKDSDFKTFADTNKISYSEDSETKLFKEVKK